MNIKQNVSYKLRTLLQDKLFYILKKYYRNNNFFSIYCQNKKYVDFNIETTYISKNGSEIPVFKNYRFSFEHINYISSVKYLKILRSKGVLLAEDIAFLNETVGERTIKRPVCEIEDYVEKNSARYKELFFQNYYIGKGVPILIPDKREIKTNFDLFYNVNRRLLNNLQRFNISHVKKQQSILDIGFTSGGYSQFAFEKLGLKVTGLDNLYGDILAKDPIPEYLRKTLSSNALFEYGDITKATNFSDKSFDYISSVSVLEHIQNVDAAFSEMHRILKPGGLLLHAFNSYYCPNGGHAYGTLDSPWAHVRMDEEDVIEYIKKYRKYEADYAIKWIKETLNRNVTNRKIQELLAANGFTIKYWTEIPPFTPNLISYLDSNILNDCLKVNASITMSELLSQSTFFVAQKT